MGPVYNKGIVQRMGGSLVSNIVKQKNRRNVLLSPFVLQLLVILFVVEFVKGALLVSILPVYMGSVLGFSAFAIGWALALQYIGDNLFRSPIGWVIDRFGYRIVMVGGLLVTFISVAIVALSSHAIWLVLACALLGIGTSPLWPCVVTGSTLIAGDKERGTVMSVVYIAWMSGVGLGPVAINFVIGGGFGIAFRILIVAMIAVLGVALFLPGRKRSDVMNGKEEAPATSENEKPLVEFKSMRGSLWARITHYFREVHRSLHVSNLFYFAMFAQTFSIGVLTPIITLYAHTVLRLSPQQYSYFLIAGGAITVLMLIPVGKLVDRWGTAMFLHVGFLLSAAAISLFPFVHGLPWLFFFVALIGLGYALIIPAWNALIASEIPDKERGAVWGFFLTIEGAGMIIGPIVSGKMWDTLGPKSPFIMSGIILAALFVLHLFISTSKKVVVR